MHKQKLIRNSCGRLRTGYICESGVLDLCRSLGTGEIKHIKIWGRGTTVRYVVAISVIFKDRKLALSRSRSLHLKYLNSLISCKYFAVIDTCVFVYSFAAIQACRLKKILIRKTSYQVIET